MNILWILLLAGALSWWFTALLRRYALARCLVDIPNERSSHVVATPRGGGVAIVLAFLVSLALLKLFNTYSNSLYWSLFGAGAWVAMAGFFDDHRHIPVYLRLFLHFVGACWALAWLGGLPPISILGITLNLGWPGQLLAVVYLIWMLNLYNFMDGIDGIAGIEALTVCLGGILLYTLSPAGIIDWGPLMLLAAAIMGFLFWNFPKAKIFMGDAGSGFIGVILGIFSIQAAWTAPELFWAWIILLGAFVVDSTITLIRRVLRGEKFYQAHRSHAYQYASRKLGRHAPVSLIFGAINLFWLLPIAVMVALRWLDGVLGILIAYIPLALLAIHFKAGARELQEI